MANKQNPDMEVFISIAMRWGVYLAATVIVIGLALQLATGNTGYPPGAFPTNIAAVIQGLALLKPAALVSLGLFLLIATPIFRVALSVFLFLYEKDYLYTVITVTVLVILVLAIAFGKSI